MDDRYVIEVKDGDVYITDPGYRAADGTLYVYPQVQDRLLSLVYALAAPAGVFTWLAAQPDMREKVKSYS